MVLQSWSRLSRLSNIVRGHRRRVMAVTAAHMYRNMCERAAYHTHLHSQLASQLAVSVQNQEVNLLNGTIFEKNCLEIHLCFTRSSRRRLDLGKLTKGRQKNQCSVGISVTRKKSPNVYKSCPKMISLENNRF